MLSLLKNWIWAPETVCIFPISHSIKSNWGAYAFSTGSKFFSWVVITWVEIAWIPLMTLFWSCLCHFKPARTLLNQLSYSVVTSLKDILKGGAQRIGYFKMICVLPQVKWKKKITQKNPKKPQLSKSEKCTFLHPVHCSTLAVQKQLYFYHSCPGWMGFVAGEQDKNSSAYFFICSTDASCSLSVTVC